MKSFRRDINSAPELSRTMKKAQLEIEYSGAKQRARAESFQEAFDKLPQMRLKKALDKIGLTSKIDVKYSKPREQQQNSKTERERRYSQLKRRYSRTHYQNKKPFQGELDEVVLDCYKPGRKKCFSQVWKIYKDNYKNLAYRTQRVLNHKGIFCPPSD